MYKAEDAVLKLFWELGDGRPFLFMTIVPYLADCGGTQSILALQKVIGTSEDVLAGAPDTLKPKEFRGMAAQAIRKISKRIG
jgi:hypothetical protein